MPAGHVDPFVFDDARISGTTFRVSPVVEPVKLIY
jgi:hypothetical protein